MKVITSGHRGKLYLEKITQLLKLKKVAKDESISAIVENLDIIETKKNYLLQEQNAVPKFLYMLIEGFARYHIFTDDGEDVSVLFLEPSEGMGNFDAIAEGSFAPHSISTISPCVLARISGKKYLELGKACPDLFAILDSEVSDKYWKLFKRVTNLLTQATDTHLNGEAELSPELIKQIPSYQLASYLRVKPQSLSRIKKKMRSNSPAEPDGEKYP